jgi:hypothetical protein
VERDEVAVAVGGSCDHPHEPCAWCGGQTLHRTNETGECEWFFCDKITCPGFLIQASR